MPLTKLSTSVFRTASTATRAVNNAIDTYNASPSLTRLEIIEKYIEKPGRAHWLAQAGEILRLEMAIKVERRAIGPIRIEGGGAGILGASALVDLRPTVWIETLFADAPSLDGIQTEGDGKQGAQGNTQKLILPGGKKLFGKTARGKDKGSEETEVQREYLVYKKLYQTAGGHPNLVKVWGWADMKIGKQHEVGFIMDRIEGPDGRTMQIRLKEAWDLGMISTAEYWSSIQYIGRCHVKVIQHLKSAGWTHNDIKPENYVVDSISGDVIVIDLGGAGLLGEKWNAVTVQYLAPEMLRGDKANHGAVGTVAADVFSLGATIAHAAEAAHAFHEVAKPNQGLTSQARPYTQVKAVDGIEAGRYKNPFQYGVETDYTRQLKRMMNQDPLEREKTIDDASSNNFLTNSILTDQQTRVVLKEVASGSRKQNWEAKWRRAGKTPPTVLTVDRTTLENTLKVKMSQYGVGKFGGITIPPTMTRSDALVKKAALEHLKREMAEIAKLINQANAFGTDTRKQKAIMNQQLRDCAAAEIAIKKVLGPA